MKKLTMSVAATALLIGTFSYGMAADRDAGPGASGASPGHEMQTDGNKGEPGASAYAPGHNKDRDDLALKGDRDDRSAGAGSRDRDDKMLKDRDYKRDRGAMRRDIK